MVLNFRCFKSAWIFQATRVPSRFTYTHEKAQFSETPVLSLSLQDLDFRAVITNVFFAEKIEVLGPVKSQISCDALYQACTRQKVLLSGILSVARS